MVGWFSKVFLHIYTCFVCFLLFYTLATYKVILKDEYWLVPVHTHGDFDSNAPLGPQATSIITWYPTQSHYPNTVLTSPCPMLSMPSTSLGGDKYQFYKSLDWIDRIRTPNLLNRTPALNRLDHRVQCHMFYSNIVRKTTRHNKLIKIPFKWTEHIWNAMHANRTWSLVYTFDGVTQHHTPHRWPWKFNIVELLPCCYMPSYALHVNIDGINGSAGLLRLLTSDNLLCPVTPAKV